MMCVVLLSAVLAFVLVDFSALTLLTGRMSAGQNCRPPQCGEGVKDQGAVCCREKEIVALGPTSADHLILIQMYRYRYQYGVFCGRGGAPHAAPGL